MNNNFSSFFLKTKIITTEFQQYWQFEITTVLFLPNKQMISHDSTETVIRHECHDQLTDFNFVSKKLIR